MIAAIAPPAADLLRPKFGKLRIQPAKVRTWVNRSCMRMILDGTVPARPIPDPHSGVAYVEADDGKAVSLAGFATFYETTAKTLWLDLLWVEAPWRRHGIATALLNMVTATAIADDLDSVELGHVTYNAPMVALMKKHGWSVDHVVRAKRVR